MLPKEQVLRTPAHGEADRVPIDYSANAGIDGRLRAHCGLDAADTEGLLQDNSPTDNVVAMYETTHSYGTY